MAVIGREAARAPLTSADINDGIVGAIDLQSTLDLSSKTITMPSIASLDVAGNLTVDTSTLYVDATNNRVGVGTTSPVSALDVSQSGDLVSSGLSITRSGANRGSIYLNSSDDTLNISRGATGAIAISASGNVGIGTTSPTAGKLQLDVGGSLAGVRVGGVTGGNQDFWAVRNGSSSIQAGPNITLQSATGTTYATTMQLGPTGEQLFFNYNGSAWNERMRIDSNGNLLVGKTTSDTSSAGHELRSGSFAAHTVDGDVALNLRRLSSDGDIARFQKDGTTVGSIGSLAGRMYVGTGDTNLFFNDVDDRIYAVTTGGSGVRDAAIDLGDPTVRFKDLYLSGGVYLGGTGAANLLDDYETGGWTPEIADAASGGNTGSATASRVIYTKVGRLVTVSAQFLNVDTTGMTAGSQLYIRGLPFASASANIAFGSIQTDNLTFRTSRTQIVPMIVASESFLTIKNIGDGLSDLTTLVSDVSSGTTDIYFSITYQAD